MAGVDDSSLQWLVMLLFIGFILRAHIFSRLLGVEQLTVHQLMEKVAEKPPLMLIDVRTPAEYAAGHAPSAVPIPLSELKSRVAEVQDRCNGRVAVVCRSGNRSLSGTVILKRAGIEHVYNVVGGMVHWEGQGYPVRK